MQSTSLSFRNPETWHIAHSYRGKKKQCRHFQRTIIVCIWDSCNGVEEGSCLSFSSGMLTGYTGLLNGCTFCSWCISENMGVFWGLGHLKVTVQEGGESIRGGEKGGPCAVGKGPDLLVLVWAARRACVNKYQFMVLWSKKDYPLRKSNLCLWVNMLCLGKYGWSRIIKGCTKCWAVNTRTRHPQLQFL